MLEDNPGMGPQQRGELKGQCRWLLEKLSGLFLMRDISHLNGFPNEFRWWKTSLKQKKHQYFPGPESNPPTFPG